MIHPADEIYFWSSIMRDHAEFQLMTLSSRETEAVQTAKQYKALFTGFMQEAAEMKGKAVNTSVLVHRVLPVLHNFIQFKRILLSRLLQCTIEINMSPTLINHMINEAFEFYRTLIMVLSGESPNATAENLQLLKIWLPDAAGHASTVAAGLDGTEEELIRQANHFKEDFNHLFIKASELNLMLPRTNANGNTLEYMNEQVESKIQDFILYLSKIFLLRQQCKALGTLSPLMADHMRREENYFLRKLRQVRKDKTGK